MIRPALIAALIALITTPATAATTVGGYPMCHTNGC